MSLTSRYLITPKNLGSVLEKIIAGAIPDKFSLQHLRDLGFGSSNDRMILPVLKDLGFLDGNGVPTQRYRDYRDRSRSKAVMAEAIRETYADLFLINENISSADKSAIVGRFKSTHGSNDNLARLQAATFLALLEFADLNAGRYAPPAERSAPELPATQERAPDLTAMIRPARGVDLRYTIEIHLPATKDREVYAAIFKSLKEDLLDD